MSKYPMTMSQISNHDEYLFLVSKINELESILAEIPVSRVIDRKGFEARLNAAREALAQLDPPAQRPALHPAQS